MSAHPRAGSPWPATLPVFSLRKTWWDDQPGIEMVQIQYAWTPLGGQPDWDDAEQTVLRTDPRRPGLRTAVIEVPRFVAGSPSYALHHFFFVVRETERRASAVFTEDVVVHEIAYPDDAGRYTSVGAVWHAVEPEVAGPAVDNYTTAMMDGLRFGAEPLSAGSGDAPLEPAAVYEVVRAQPLPHVFRALVWGIAGTRLNYRFQLLRAGSPDPADDRETWADDGGDGWTVEL